MNTPGRVGPLPATLPLERTPSPAAPAPRPPLGARGDTVSIGAIPVRSAELLAWVRSRLAEPMALPDLRAVRVPIPAAAAALRADPAMRAELGKWLATQGWSEPSFEAAPDGSWVLRSTRAPTADPVPTAVPTPNVEPTVVVRDSSPAAAVSRWIADRVATLVDPSRPLLELPLSGPADRSIAVLLRSDAGLRAHALDALLVAGFPRATLDDLDLPSLARITLRHPEREVRRGGSDPEREVAQHADTAHPRSTTREVLSEKSARPDLHGLTPPASASLWDGTSARLHLAEVFAFSRAHGTMLPLPRWTSVPLGIVVAIALWWLLS